MCNYSLYAQMCCAARSTIYSIFCKVYVNIYILSPEFIRLEKMYTVFRFISCCFFLSHSYECIVFKILMIIIQIYQTIFSMLISEIWICSKSNVYNIKDQ